MDWEHRSRSSKHSESQPEAIDGSGSNYHLEPYPKLRVRIGSSDRFEVQSENHGSAGSNKHSESHPDFTHGNVSSKHSTSQPHVPVYEGNLLFHPIKSASSSSSSSSSSSPLSSNNPFQLSREDSFNPRKCTASFHKPDVDTQPELKDGESGIRNNSYSKSEGFENASPGLILKSPDLDITHESLGQSLPPTQSPPVQVMERSEGYDPFRIPSSIFTESVSTPPLDWSAASNESLFSIHVGNNSFSRDHALLGDLNFSGELTKSGELTMFSPPTPVVAPDGHNQSADRQPTETEKDGLTGVAAAAEVQRKEQKVAPAESQRSSCTSDRSGDSTQSFAFPILMNVVKSGSEKTDVGLQQPQPVLDAPANSKLASYGWFGRLSCCPCCCSYSCCCCC